MLGPSQPFGFVERFWWIGGLNGLAGAVRRRAPCECEAAWRLPLLSLKKSGCGAGNGWQGRLMAQCASHSLETASRASCIQRCLSFCLSLASSARKDRGVLLAYWDARAQPHLAGAVMPVQYGIGPSSFMRGVLSCPVCDSFCWLRPRDAVDGHWCAVAGQRSEAGGSGHAVGCLCWDWRRRWREKKRGAR